MNEFHPLSVELDEEKQRVPVQPQLLILAVVLLAIFGAGFIPSFFDQEPELQQVVETPAATVNIGQAIQSVRPDAYFNDVAIHAQAAFVWDVTAQRMLYEKNPDTQLPLASITKLMTALVAHELVSSQELVSVPMSAVMQSGESGITNGEVFDLQNLSDFTLLTSSNDGAYAMAASAGTLLDTQKPAESFVQAMNIRAGELGLTQTFFRNPTGLDISETEAGAYGSARDVAFLMEYILKNNPLILEETTKVSSVLENHNGEVHTASNTNQIIDALPGIIGSKTGYTELAGGNLTVAFDTGLNRPVIIVVLGSTLEGRFKDVAVLASKTKQVIQ